MKAIRLNSNRKKQVKQSKPAAIASVKEPPTTQAASASRTIQNPPVSKALGDWLTQTFGTEDRALQDRFLFQAAGGVSDFGGRELESFDYVAAGVRGTGPRDSLEGMLAVQMVAVHTLAMECIGRAALREQPDVGIEVYINRATKLLRTFANQTEALLR